MYTVPTIEGDFTPITASDSSSAFAVFYFPDDERMLYRADGNGDEIYHIYLRDLDGTITNLIPDEGSMALFYGWVHDGKSLGYGSNKRDKRYMDIYEMEISDMSSKLIYQNVEGYDLNTISKDKNLLALSKTITRNEIDLYLFDRTDKSYTKINNSLSRNSAESFSLDGTSLFYSTDEGSEFLHLMTYDIATGKKKKL